MNLHLISYDLKAPGRNYQPVWDYLGNSTSFKPLESVYIIQTSKSAVTVRDELRTLVDSNDKIIVIDITTSAWATYNLPKTTAWLKDR